MALRPCGSRGTPLGVPALSKALFCTGTPKGHWLILNPVVGTISGEYQRMPQGSAPTFTRKERDLAKCELAHRNSLAEQYNQPIYSNYTI
jgi:hypothetical protein